MFQIERIQSQLEQSAMGVASVMGEFHKFDEMAANDEYLKHDGLNVGKQLQQYDVDVEYRELPRAISDVGVEEPLPLSSAESATLASTRTSPNSSQTRETSDQSSRSMATGEISTSVSGVASQIALEERARQVVHQTHLQTEMISMLTSVASKASLIISQVTTSTSIFLKDASAKEDKSIMLNDCLKEYPSSSTIVASNTTKEWSLLDTFSPSGCSDAQAGVSHSCHLAS